MPKFAILGDVHGLWDESDLEYFKNSEHDILLFVGDFVQYSQKELFRITQEIDQLQKPVYFILGNHDTVFFTQLLGEIWHNKFLSSIGQELQKDRLDTLKKSLRHAVLCGYSRHKISPNLELVAGRPFSMGGGLNFPSIIEREYGIKSLKESAEKIRELILRTENPYLILAHHGPQGLGEKKTDIFGADFLARGGDWGDFDLKEALDFAKEKNKKPIAVIAGHMHYPNKHGGLARRWYLEQDGILYVNAARYPRIFSYKGKTYHHFVELTLGPKNQLSLQAIYRQGNDLLGQKDPFAYLPPDN